MARMEDEDVQCVELIQNAERLLDKQSHMSLSFSSNATCLVSLFASFIICFQVVVSNRYSISKQMRQFQNIVAWLYYSIFNRNKGERPCISIFKVNLPWGFTEYRFHR
jgi:hypothetical protein